MKSILFAAAVVVACMDGVDAKAQGYGPRVYSGVPAYGPVARPPLTFYNYGNGASGRSVQVGGASFYRDSYGNSATGISVGNSTYYQYRQAPASNYYQAPANSNPFAFPTIGW